MTGSAARNRIWSLILRKNKQVTLDSHQHFWKYSPAEHSWISDDMRVIRRDFLPEDLEPVLMQNNVDGTVAVQADQSLEETQFLMDLAEKNPFIKAVVGWVDLQHPKVQEQLDEFKTNPLFKGVRHIVQAESDPEFMLRPAFLDGLEVLSQNNLTYDILIYAPQLPMAVECVKKNPNLKFVIDHIAKPVIGQIPDEFWTRQISLLGEIPNVYCKISGMVTEATANPDYSKFMDVVAENFGTDRLMFGSDWPVCLVKEPYAGTKKLVENYFSDNERQKIMGQNAADFYGI